MVKKEVAIAKEKTYAFKYHVIKVRSGEIHDQLNSLNLKCDEYNFINLKVKDIEFNFSQPIDKGNSYLLENANANTY